VAYPYAGYSRIRQVNKMYGYDHNMFGFGAFWMIIIWIIIIVALVLLIKSLVGKGSSGSGEKSDGPSAMEILKRRYASGEISKEEFEQKKKDLIS
jgi:putative membrane protein